MDDFKWLFGLILLFGVFWFVSRGINSPDSQKPLLSPIVGNDEVNYGPSTVPLDPRQTGGSYSVGGKPTSKSGGISENITDAAAQAADIKKKLEELEAASKLSPLAKKVRLAGISGGAGSATNEYVILQADSANAQSVLITGLRLQSSASGRGANIPKGVALPLQNSINTESPIYLAPGERAYVMTGRSPVGASFRLNACIGFFGQYQTFNPGLPQRCPPPRSEPLPPPANQYSDECLDYINSLPSCQVIVNPPPSVSPECRRYVTTEISYTKCVERHKNDRGFYDPEWRIYLGRDDTLWKSRREFVNLLDANGKVIDTVTY